MSDPRDDLAKLIKSLDIDMEAMECLNEHDIGVLTDGIIAAGWKSPEQVDDILDREFEQR